MTEPVRSAAALRFFGAELLPSEITRYLGCNPTRSYARGETIINPSGSRYVASRGYWSLQAAIWKPADLDSQIAEIFSKLSTDLTVWERLTMEHQADLFCGLWLSEGMGETLFSSASLRLLADRGIVLDLDMYGEEA